MFLDLHIFHIFCNICFELFRFRPMNLYQCNESCKTNWKHIPRNKYFVNNKCLLLAFTILFLFFFNELFLIQFVQYRFSYVGFLSEKKWSVVKWSAVRNWNGNNCLFFLRFIDRIEWYLVLSEWNLTQVPNKKNDSSTSIWRQSLDECKSKQDIHSSKHPIALCVAMIFRI